MASMLLFAPTLAIDLQYGSLGRTGGNTCTHARRPRTSAVRCMAEDGSDFKGFGAKPVKRAPSEGQKRRDAAASKYDEMAARGMPEYSVWIRLKEPPRPEGVSADDPDFQSMPWLPVGSLAVPRSSQVASAIYEAEDDLLSGAFKLYPNMAKEERENFEYGFQNKQFPDEDVRLALRPVEGGIMGAFTKWVNRLTNPMNTA